MVGSHSFSFDRARAAHPRHATRRAPVRLHRALLAAATTAALLAAAHDAHAQELKPLVLVLLDTSSLMEFENGPGTTLPTCYDTTAANKENAQCLSQPANASHTRSRFTVAIEALTGKFSAADYKCCAYVRSSQEPDPLVAKHYGVPRQVPQTQDGILDIYREDVRFGLMTYDNHPGPNSGNAGFFSYGGGTSAWNAGALDVNANRGHHGYSSLERATGALQVIPHSDDPATLATGNDNLQKEIRYLFPRGTYAPIAPIIDDAHYYLVHGTGKALQNEACYTQRPKGVILVTAGFAHFDACYETNSGPYELDGDGDNDDCSHYVHDDGGNGASHAYDYPESYYKNSEYQAARLLQDTGFPTYVIGFNAAPEADAKLRAIAAAGGTCDKVPGCIYTAHSEEQLRFAFHEIIAQLAAETPIVSRTHPVTTTRTSFRYDQAGYYEVSARYTRSSTGTWSGNLERVTFACDASGDMAVDSVVDFADIMASQPSRTLLTSTPSLAPGTELPSLAAHCGDIPGCDASVLDTLSTPRLADILHSNPTIAVAPELDLPLGGYKDFRRSWGHRDTLLFVGTNDGLLHAFTLADVDGSGDVEGRERWAYVPRAVHAKLAHAQSEHLITVDGTPVIKDVRLSRRIVDGAVEETWGTVLVGTLRGGGRGVFALDITDPDHPRHLWEHTAHDGAAEARPLARLGYTYGKPAVGAVVVQSDSVSRYETAVAIVPGGLSSGSDPGEGQVVYVVELSSGAVLREFTTLSDGTPLAEVSGSVAAFSQVPGTVMTRAFVGDAQGRLLRLDLSPPDPARWRLDVFLDPAGAGLLSDATPQVERVMVAPAISRDRLGNLVIHYGTGDVSSLNPMSDFDNFVVSVTELQTFAPDGSVTATAKVNWLKGLDDGAKLTGSPLVFNNTVFFPTLENSAGTAGCGGDKARLWAAHFTESLGGDLKPTTDLDGDGTVDVAFTDFAPGTVVFGLDVAVRPACYELEELAGVYRLRSPRSTSPQLVLQTGNPPYGAGQAPPATSTTPPGVGEHIEKVRIDLPPPPTTLRTTSWGAIYE